jgi:hypothetical protein
VKSRLLIITILTALLLSVTSILSAQDASKPEFSCDLPTLQKAIDVYVSELGKLVDSKETDTTKISDTLQEMANTANIMRATCDGYVFEGKKQTVLGPIEFPAGVYKAVAKTTGNMFAILTPTDGECGQGPGHSSNLFLISEGDATDGAETVFSSNGCTVLIEVSEIQADWSLSFERVTTK